MPYPYDLDEEARRYEEPKLKTDRSVWKYIVFSILTLGLYNIIFFAPLAYELDKVAPKSDRSKTMSFLSAFILAYFTFSIVLLIWHHQIAERVEDALRDRHITFDFGTDTFWTWQVFGSLILVGPFVYVHKLCQAMNLLCADYNEKNASAKK